MVGVAPAAWRAPQGGQYCRKKSDFLPACPSIAMATSAAPGRERQHAEGRRGHAGGGPWQGRRRPDGTRTCRNEGHAAARGSTVPHTCEARSYGVSHYICLSRLHSVLATLVLWRVDVFPFAGNPSYWMVTALTLVVCCRAKTLCRTLLDPCAMCQLLSQVACDMPPFDVSCGSIPPSQTQDDVIRCALPRHVCRDIGGYFLGFVLNGPLCW